MSEIPPYTPDDPPVFNQAQGAAMLKRIKFFYEEVFKELGMQEKTIKYINYLVGVKQMADVMEYQATGNAPFFGTEP